MTATPTLATLADDRRRGRLGSDSAFMFGAMCVIVGLVGFMIVGLAWLVYLGNAAGLGRFTGPPPIGLYVMAGSALVCGVLLFTWSDRLQRRENAWDALALDEFRQATVEYLVAEYGITVPAAEVPTMWGIRTIVAGSRDGTPGTFVLHYPEPEASLTVEMHTAPLVPYSQRVWNWRHGIAS